MPYRKQSIYSLGSGQKQPTKNFQSSIQLSQKFAGGPPRSPISKMAVPWQGRINIGGPGDPLQGVIISL